MGEWNGEHSAEKEGDASGVNDASALKFCGFLLRSVPHVLRCLEVSHYVDVSFEIFASLTFRNESEYHRCMSYGFH